MGSAANIPKTRATRHDGSVGPIGSTVVSRGRSVTYPVGSGDSEDWTSAKNAS